MKQEAAAAAAAVVSTDSNKSGDEVAAKVSAYLPYNYPNTIILYCTI